MAYSEKRLELEKAIESSNLAEGMDDHDLNLIAQKVIEEYDIDKESRSEWEDRTKLAMGMATNMLQSFSGESSSDFKDVNFPLLLTAAISFSARAYTQLVQFGNIVKAKVIGRDQDNTKASKANRVQTHMNYQLSEQMENWGEDTDYLLTALPIEGCEFKKTYFNPSDKVNVSEWIRPNDLVLNYKAKSIEKAARYTHVIKLYPNEIVERINSGVFLDLKEIRNVAPNDGDEENPSPTNDDDAPHIFYEQHRYLDLDDDGYKEPYVVTVHKGSQKVVRIIARFDIDGVQFNEKTGKVIRIKPVHYITRFLFMPSPDGGVYGMGYGNIIGPVNLASNAILNEIVEAGFLANTQGGFVGKGVSMKKGRGGGDIEFEQGEFKQVNYSGDDIRKHILALPFKGPEPTLFSVFDRLINAGEKLGSITDPLVGESPGADVPATTILALIEQGSKIPSSVYVRLHQSFRSEYRKLFRLNSIYLEDEEYFNINDDEKSVARADYDYKSCDVVPISNPAEISNTHKLLMAQVLREFMGMGLNDNAIIRRNLEALQVSDIEEILPEQGAQQKPDPKTLLEIQKLELERNKHELEMFESQFKVAKLQSEVLLNIAKAEGVEMGQQMDLYMETMKNLTERMKIRAQGASNAGQQSKQAGT